MLILPTQGKDFLRRCCTYFGIGGALILELTPMGAALIGIVFLGEKLTLNSALGIFLIFISVVLTLFVSSVKREDEGKAEKLC